MKMIRTDDVPQLEIVDLSGYTVARNESFRTVQNCVCRFCGEKHPLTVVRWMQTGKFHRSSVTFEAEMSVCEKSKTMWMSKRQQRQAREAMRLAYEKKRREGVTHHG